MLVVFWVDLKLIGLSHNFAPAIYPAELDVSSCAGRSLQVA